MHVVSLMLFFGSQTGPPELVHNTSKINAAAEREKGRTRLKNISTVNTPLTVSFSEA